MNSCYRNLTRILILILSGQPAFAQFGSVFGSGINSTSSLNNQRAASIMAYMKTKEEGGNLKAWWKAEETFGITYAGTATYTKVVKFDPGEFSTQAPIDTTMSISLAPKVGFHLNGNSNHLLVRVSDNSIVSFSVGVQLDFINWTYSEQKEYSGEVKNNTVNYIQLGVPLTIDYKMGADVDFDRHQKTCFAIGAGFYPHFGFPFNGFNDYTSADFKMSPYFYASFGFFAGACWKIRASCIPGNYRIMESKLDLNGTTTTTYVTGPGMYTLGIGIMDWSWDWGKGNGWRGRSHGSGGGGGGRRYRARENVRMF